jgi:O-Antigen ligase
LLVFAALAVGSFGRQLSVPLPAKLFLGLAAFCVLQALPLPQGVVRALSPTAAETWLRAWEVSRPGGHGLMSLSLDPRATWVEALKWSMYAAAFLTAMRYGEARSMARGLLLPLGAALAVGGVTLGHGLARATTVYGVYRPSFGPSIWHIGPLLNPNHLAGYLNLGMFCGIGLLVARRAVLPRWVLGLAIAFMVPNAIVAGSRGGILGIAAGSLVFWLFLPKPRYADADWGPVSRRLLVLMLASVAAVAAILTVLLVSDNTSRELYDRNLDKLHLFQWTIRLIRDFPLVGVGRGAFESVFAAYRNGANNEIYTHPENLLAQWGGEWGVVGVLALAGGAFWLRPRRLGTRWSVVATGAVAGVGAIVAQNLVDFALEVPAVALSVVVAVGVCYGHARGRRQEVMERAPSRPFLNSAWVPLAVALAFLPLVLGARPLALARLDLAGRYNVLEKGDSNSLSELWTATLKEVEAHPAEPYFFRLGALLAWRSGRDPMPWLQRALERGPSLGRTHLVVARVLAARGGIKQALLQLRLAGTYDPALTPVLAQAAATWTTDYELLVRAARPGAVGVPMLVAIAKLLPVTDSVRERLLLEARARDASQKLPLLLLAGEAVRQLEQRGPQCEGELLPSCTVNAERLTGELERQSEGDVDGLLLRARLLKAAGKVDQAAELMIERCPTLAGRPRTTCFRAEMDLLARDATDAAFSSITRQYLTETCADSDACAAALERVGDLTAARNQLLGAMALYERALRERSDDRLLMKLARVGVKLGAHQRVSVVLERVRARVKFEPEYSRLVQAAREGSWGVKAREEKLPSSAPTGAR